MKKHTTHHKSVVKAEKAVDTVQETPLKKNLFPIALVIVLVGIFAFLKLARSGAADVGKMKSKIIPEAVKKILNNPSTKIEIVKVTEVSGLFEFELKVDNKAYTSYISRDGKILFTSGIKIADFGKAGAQQTGGSVKTAPKDIKKAEKPNLIAYVVANCPYGLQMQRVFKKAINELPDLAANLSVRYIGAVENGKITAMHGDEEAQENLKQICIREEQQDKYWPYVSCYMQEGKTEECLTATGVNSSELTSCTTDANRGLKYAKTDFDMANKYKVSGSPTLLANGDQTVSEFDFGGRNANAIKDIICAASKNKPGYCSKEISKVDMAASLSKTDEADPSSGAAPATSGSGCAPAK